MNRWMCHSCQASGPDADVPHTADCPNGSVIEHVAPSPHESRLAALEARLEQLYTMLESDVTRIDWNADRMRSAYEYLRELTVENAKDVCRLGDSFQEAIRDLERDVAVLKARAVSAASPRKRRRQGPARSPAGKTSARTAKATRRRGGQARKRPTPTSKRGA